MTARARLITDAAKSIAETRPQTQTFDHLLGADATDAGPGLSDAAAFACVAVIEQLYPQEHAAIQHATAAFGDGFADLVDAVGDVSFAVGMAYGVLVAKGGAQ